MYLFSNSYIFIHTLIGEERLEVRWGPAERPFQSIRLDLPPQYGWTPPVVPQRAQAERPHHALQVVSSERATSSIRQVDRTLQFAQATHLDELKYEVHTYVCTYICIVLTKI